VCDSTNVNVPANRTQSSNANSTAQPQSNTNCDTYFCSEDSGLCSVKAQECALPQAIVIAVGLTAGVIAGIVVGVIAFVALAGGASYAAFQKMGTGGADAVVNNPLYKSQGKSGTNPLFKAGE